MYIHARALSTDGGIFVQKHSFSTAAVYVEVAERDAGASPALWDSLEHRSLGKSLK